MACVVFQRQIAATEHEAVKDEMVTMSNGDGDGDDDDDDDADDDDDCDDMMIGCSW